MLAGQRAAAEVARQMGIRATATKPDGSHLAPGDTVLRIEGDARRVLACERTLLNLMCRLSGIATMTAAFVRVCSPVPVLDTRKTTPGLRGLEKEAVRAGGGTNHRHGLDDRALIKDNHLALGGVPLLDAVANARALLPDAPVEVEADDLAGLERAIAANADWVLLDNMDAGTLRRAVALAAGRVCLEASGGMSLDRARQAALTGVDAISVGALTHSAPALDLGLDIIPRGAPPA